MLERKEDLARTMTLEQGKPLKAARNEVQYAADFLIWFAEEAKRIAAQKLESQKESDLKKSSSDSGFHAWVFVVIAAIIDTFIIACVWFPIFALYRTTKEYQRLTQVGESTQVLSETPMDEII